MSARIWIGTGSLFGFRLGRWVFFILTPPRKWLWWAWREPGYDSWFEEWYFGPFMELWRASDDLVALEAEADDEGGL